jgi:DNA-binding response OmpR family regulator
MTRTFLCFGPFDPADPHLQSAAQAANGELRFAATMAELGLSQLPRRPDVVLLRLDAPDLDELMSAHHTHPRLEGAPLIIVLPRLTPTSAVRAATLGADDFLAADDLAALLPGKLSAASQEIASPPPATQCRVLLGDSSPLHAHVLGRLLGQAGFVVTTVFDGEQAFAELSTPGFGLAIIDLGLPKCDAATLLEVAATPPPAIAMSHAGVHSERGSEALAHGYRHVHDKHRPPDELVFLANEASSRVAAPQRSSPRLLCATLVGFRREGGRWEYGLSHNLSQSGMYVRTIAPPPPGAALDLEFTPPGMTNPISCRGQVAWRKDFGQRALRTAPTGMGIKLLEPDETVRQAMTQAAKLLATQGPTAK